MAAGSSMLATIRTVPPQWTQAVTSMEKTRLALRPAHRTALLLGAARRVVRAGVRRLHSGVMPPAAPRWRQLCAQGGDPGRTPRQNTPADVFVANILAGPLAELAPRFATCVKPGAPFALSGILVGQADELLARYAEWFDHLVVATREDWVRISGHRRGD